MCLHRSNQSREDVGRTWYVDHEQGNKPSEEDERLHRLLLQHKLVIQPWTNGHRGAWGGDEKSKPLTPTPLRGRKITTRTITRARILIENLEMMESECTLISRLPEEELVTSTMWRLRNGVLS